MPNSVCIEFLKKKNSQKFLFSFFVCMFIALRPKQVREYKQRNTIRSPEAIVCTVSLYALKVLCTANVARNTTGPKRYHTSSMNHLFCQISYAKKLLTQFT